MVVVVSKRGYYHNHHRPQITNMQQDNKVQTTTSYQSIQLCFYKAHQQQGMMHLQNLLNFPKGPGVEVEGEASQMPKSVLLDFCAF